MSLTLGIDLGSSAVKGALFDPAAGVLATAAAPTDMFTTGTATAEADPAQWWDGARAVVRDLLVDAGAGAVDVAAISVSGMVPAVVPLDACGRPLRRAILQNDARAAVEVEELRARFADADLLARTGSIITQQSVPPTLLWLWRHEPSLRGETRAVVGSYDWLLHRLGAELHVERNWAIESGLFALDGSPLDELFAAAGADPGLVPEPRDPGDVVGGLTAEAARELSLLPGTPLVVSTADHVASAYAAGLVREGSALVKLGGAGDILAVSSTPRVDPRLYLDRHVIPGLWLPNGCMTTSGTLLRWFQAELAGASDLALLDDEAAAIAPGADGLLCLPYLLGEKSPLHDPDLRGAFVGLHLGHRRGHLFRACLEAVAFGFRHHLDVYAEIGIPVATARVTNGGANSRLWKQVIADVCRLSLAPVVGHPGAALGAALAAAVAVGLMPGWDAAAGYVELGEEITPDPGAAAVYDSCYETYLLAGRALEPVSHQIAREARAHDLEG